MFRLAKLKDVVRIKPDHFKYNLLDTICTELNKKLSNKVIINVGLCVCVRDILKIVDSYMIPGDGSSHTEVIFHCLVFRPNIGSIVTGKIRCCTKAGVHITLGFFDDILVPPYLLQHPSRFDAAEHVWVWEYPLPDGGTHDLFMDIGEPIKFRVEKHIYQESSPIGPPVVEGQPPSTSPDAPSPATVVAMQQMAPEIPFSLIGAVNDYGLGLVSWWAQQKKSEVKTKKNEGNEEQYENDEDGEGACEE